MLCTMRKICEFMLCLDRLSLQPQILQSLNWRKHAKVGQKPSKTPAKKQQSLCRRCFIHTAASEGDQVVSCWEEGKGVWSSFEIHREQEGHSHRQKPSLSRDQDRALQQEHKAVAEDPGWPSVHGLTELHCLALAEFVGAHVRRLACSWLEVIASALGQESWRGA